MIQFLLFIMTRIRVIKGLQAMIFFLFPSHACETLDACYFRNVPIDQLIDFESVVKSTLDRLHFIDFVTLYLKNIWDLKINKIKCFFVFRIKLKKKKIEKVDLNSKEDLLTTNSNQFSSILISSIDRSVRQKQKKSKSLCCECNRKRKKIMAFNSLEANYCIQFLDNMIKTVKQFNLHLKSNVQEETNNLLKFLSVHMYTFHFNKT